MKNFMLVRIALKYNIERPEKIITSISISREKLCHIIFGAACIVDWKILALCRKLVGEKDF